MPSLMPHTTTATQVQRNYKKVSRKAKKLKEPITVLSNNKPDLVVMDYKVYENLKKRDLTRSRRTRSDLNKFFGLWSKEEADRFDKIIEEEFEQIDPEDRK